MSRDTINVTDKLIAYIRNVGIHEDADLAALRQETAHHRMAMMQIGPEQGAFMALLVRLLGARKTLEVGVFTGYSSMVVAKAMGPEGKVLALDVSEEFTAVARRHWAKAGIADRIELRLRAAAESLQELVAKGAGASFCAGLDLKQAMARRAGQQEPPGVTESGQVSMLGAQVGTAPLSGL